MRQIVSLTEKRDRRVFERRNRPIRAVFERQLEVSAEVHGVAEDVPAQDRRLRARRRWVLAQVQERREQRAESPAFLIPTTAEPIFGAGSERCLLVDHQRLVGEDCGLCDRAAELDFGSHGLQ